MVGQHGQGPLRVRGPHLGHHVPRPLRRLDPLAPQPGAVGYVVDDPGRGQRPPRGGQAPLAPGGGQQRGHAAGDAQREQLPGVAVVEPLLVDAGRGAGGLQAIGDPLRRLPLLLGSGPAGQRGQRLDHVADGLKSVGHVPNLYERYQSAFAELEPPFAFVDLDAVRANADVMLGQARGKPIRVASKSVRCRALLRRLLARSDGFQGLLDFTVPEALWLYEHGFRNLVVAYPWTGVEALARLAALTASDPTGAPAVMVDSVEHLDLVRSVVSDGAPPVRVCMDIDVGYWPLGGRLKFGPK